MEPRKSGQLNFYLRSQQTGTIKVKWCDYLQANYLRARVVPHSHITCKVSCSRNDDRQTDDYLATFTIEGAKRNAA